MRVFISILVFCANLIAEDVIVSGMYGVGYYRGSYVKAGNFDLVFSSDLFPQASQETPIYLRCGFSDSNVTLSQTLVDLSQPNLPQEPIYLALTGRSRNAHATAPADAISIVRWRKGEKAFWIKITSPTSHWLGYEETLHAPTESESVGFSVGLSMDEAKWSSPWIKSEFNIAPYLQTQKDRLATSEIYLDLSTSSLPYNDVMSRIYSRFAYYDSTTNGVEDKEDITLGNQLPIESLDAFLFYAIDKPYYSKQIIAPWVSWNDQFDSELILNNRDAASVDLLMTLRRADGSQSQVTRSIAPWASFREPIGTLFPEWTRGTGATLEIQYTEANLSANISTYLRQGCSGYSPAIAEAIHTTTYWYAPEGYRYEFGPTLSFGNLVADEHFFSAIVLVNLGDEPVAANLMFIDKNGHPQALSTNAGQNLEPLKPRAILLNDLFPNGDVPPLLLVDIPGGKLCGTTFLFNSNGEPAMSPAKPFELPIPVLLPKN